MGGEGIGSESRERPFNRLRWKDLLVLAPQVSLFSLSLSLFPVETRRVDFSPRPANVDSLYTRNPLQPLENSIGHPESFAKNFHISDSCKSHLKIA